MRSSARIFSRFRFSTSFPCRYGAGAWLGKRGLCVETKLTSINQEIVQFGKEKKLDAAFALYDDLHNTTIQPSSQTVALLLEACARSGETDRAFDFFFRAQQDGVQPNIHIYNALMKNCAVTGKLERGNLLLQQMSEAGINPNQKTFHRMMQMSIQANKLDAAEQLMSSMGKFGYKPSVVTYNILIKGQVIHGDIKSAIKVYVNMQRQGVLPNADTFSLLIEYSSSNQGFKFLGEMKRFGVKPSLKIYNSFLAACGREGNADRAYQVYEIMNENKVTPDRTTLNTLMAATIKTKEYDQTYRFIEKMSELNIQPNLTTYNIMLARLCKLRQLDSIIELLSEMIHAEILPNVTSFNTVLTLCIDTKDKVTAQKIVEQMKQLNIEPNDTTHKYLKELEGDDEKETLEPKQRSKQKNEDSGMPGWKKIIEAQEKQEEEARRELIFLNCHKLYLIDDTKIIARKDDAPPLPEDEEEQKNLYNQYFELICLFADEGQVAKSFQLVSIMKDIGLEITADVYNQLIVGLGNVGKLDSIEQVVHVMNEEGLSIEIETYNAIIAAYGICAEFDQAIQVLDVIEEDRLQPNAETFVILLRACITSDSKEYGLETTRHVLNKLENSEIEYSDELSNLLVGAYERIKDYPKAQSAYRAVKMSGQLNEDGMGAMLSVAAATKDKNLPRELFEDTKTLPEGETKDAMLALIEDTWNLK
uniref:Pentacotripeptide-repeat region of PRORP domain-containing protein n=1 Tax=Vannella robusta TaxID=1487602 RepID=A0A7S4HPB8_9EUKA